MIPLPPPTTSGIFQNYYFFLATSRLIQDYEQSIKTQCFVPYALTKLIVGSGKIRHLHAPTKTVMHNTMVYLSTKLAMRKVLVTISPVNPLNIALVTPKFLSHLLQFMSFQVFLLLLEI